MNAVIYSHAYPNEAEQGRSPFVRELVRYLPPDIRVTVVAPVPFFLSTRRKERGVKIPRLRTERLGGREVEIHRPRYPLLPGNLLRPWLYWLEAAFTLSCLRQLKRRGLAELIHVNWSYPDGCAANLLSRRLRLPYVLTEHQGSISNLLAKGYYNRLIGRAYRQSGRLILVSEGLREPLKMVRGGIPEAVVIPNGIDAEKFTLKARGERLRKLLYVGNLIPQKGLQYLLEALRSLRDEGGEFTLEIVGQGKYEPVLRAQTKRLGLGDAVNFYGFAAPERIPELLLAYDALVLPTLTESFGLVLIEALAAGLPVLSTLCSGPRSIVSPEVGILVQPGSAAALAGGIRELEKRWEEFEPSSLREYCVRRFDLQRLGERLGQVYREAARPSGSGSKGSHSDRGEDARD